ncbi:bacteriohemerythrin [Telmatospirillum siberiense]|uniref:bacteriohemerythrin n=1 Tax=Telmatospirillum siberiense TaxID=382514 RepID=UPI001303F9EC|nr:bacteriohemerythrin [Telmatospirillum siberiense]
MRDLFQEGRRGFFQQGAGAPGMSLIRWQDTFTIGVADIDADHQVLISLLNQLSETREEGQSRDVVGSVFNVLIEYTIKHFAREERLMELCGFSGLAEHRQQHQRIAERVQKYQRQYEAGCHTAVDELLDFLNNWLVEHIIGEDTHIRSWVEGACIAPRELAPAVQE